MTLRRRSRTNLVVLNAIDQIWALSEKMNVTIQYDFSNEELWTHAEPDLLERAVVNLLSNAIKHSEAGAIVTVTVKLDNNEITNLGKTVFLTYTK